MKINFIDLFSGAGGLSAGFSKAGLNCLAGIDFLKPAMETFGLNHKNAIGVHADIRKIKTKEFKKIIKKSKILEAFLGLPDFFSQGVDPYLIIGKDQR